MTKSRSAATSTTAGAYISDSTSRPKPARLRSGTLRAHFNAQLHMSFSGIDYYGSDLGGFRREVLPHSDKQGRYRGYTDTPADA